MHRFTTKSDGVLIELLQARYPDSSRTTLRKLLRHGRVRVDGRIGKIAEAVVHAGQVIDVLASREAAVRPPAPILYHDPWLLVVDKPAGLLSVSRLGGEDTLYRRVNRFAQESSGGARHAYIVHRLDREVSGAMLFALDRDARDRLQDGWSRSVKVYWALVEGRPASDQGTIRSRLRENRIHRVRSTPSGEGKLAVTHYRVRRAGSDTSLLEVQIETGRKNQIRVHLSELGCPIVGDRRYGARTRMAGRLGLHAALLAFEHPVTGAWIEARAPIPRELAALP